MAAPQYATTDLIRAGVTQSSYVAGILDANGHLAVATTLFNQTPSGLLLPGPADAQGLPISAPQATAPTFAAGTGAIASTNTATTLTVALGSLAQGSGVFNANQVNLKIANNGTGQTITQISLSLTDTVGGLSVGPSYSQTVSIASNAAATVVLLLPNGLGAEASLALTFGAAPTAGSINVVAQFQATTPQPGIAPNQAISAVMQVNDGPNFFNVTSARTSDNVGGGQIVPAATGRYNPSTGRFRNATTNFPATVLASTTSTTSVVTANQTNINARGILLSVNVTAATGDLTPIIETTDPASGTAYALATPAAITATGIYTYALYPGASGGSVTAAYSLPLPDTWFVNAVISGTTPSFTFSIGVRYIL